MARIYDEQQIDWLIQNHSKFFSYQDITKKFNSIFCTDKSVISIQQFLGKRLRIHLMTEKNSHHFNVAETEWLIENCIKVNDYKKLTSEFNTIFAKNKSVQNIKDKCIKSLRLKGVENKTIFKKGNEQEQLPIGTIRKSKNGRTYIKVKDSRFGSRKGYAEPWWLPIQKKVWIDHYGEVPKGKMVTFLDGNTENIDINNLYCVDRKISAVMASKKWYSDNREFTLTAIKWCELFYAMKDNKNERVTV